MRDSSRPENSRPENDPNDVQVTRHPAAISSAAERMSLPRLAIMIGRAVQSLMSYQAQIMPLRRSKPGETSAETMSAEAKTSSGSRGHRRVINGCGELFWRRCMAAEMDEAPGPRRQTSKHVKAHLVFASTAGGWSMAVASIFDQAAQVAVSPPRCCREEAEQGRAVENARDPSGQTHGARRLQKRR